MGSASPRPTSDWPRELEDAVPILILDVARAFLAHQSIAGPEDLRALTSADVSGFVLSQSRRRTIGYAKSTTTRLRSLLRYLEIEGLTPSALAARPSVSTRPSSVR